MLKNIIIIMLFIPFFVFSQVNQEKTNYQKAFTELVSILESDNLDFKRAVLITENAYFDNLLDTNEINEKILFLKNIILLYISNTTIKYTEKDKQNVEKLGAVFTILTDTISIQANNKLWYHLPYTYDFEDIWGKQEWSNMFVSKLLTTNKGNCHSLPFLYKILADELGVEAHLALAPNHIYIKTKSEEYGWYNTELTSAMFPVDTWIMASGYIHLNAIQSSLYMSALDDKQSIAICMTDLAEGYARKTNFTDPDFILMCCDTALKYYPNYVNAILLKIKTQKYQFVTELNKTKPDTQKADKLFAEMELLSTNLYLLGYRQMPKEMYLDWLISLKLERERYTNKKIMNTEKQKK